MLSNCAPMAAICSTRWSKSVTILSSALSSVSRAFFSVSWARKELKNRVKASTGPGRKKFLCVPSQPRNCWLGTASTSRYVAAYFSQREGYHFSFFAAFPRMICPLDIKTPRAQPMLKLKYPIRAVNLYMLI